MSKYILIPTPSRGVCPRRISAAFSSGEIRRLQPEAEIHAIPVADGGEGTVDAFSPPWVESASP